MRTEIVFILDASGSMAGLEADTVGGFNSLIEKNREEPGEAVASTVAEVRTCPPSAAMGNTWRAGLDADVRARRR